MQRGPHEVNPDPRLLRPRLLLRGAGQMPHAGPKRVALQTVAAPSDGTPDNSEVQATFCVKKANHCRTSGCELGQKQLRGEIKTPAPEHVL